MADHYDVIVIGSGPGGGSLVHRLAPTGKRILLLERGDYLPRSPANWDSQTVFVDGAYQAKETWYGEDGRSFIPDCIIMSAATPRCTVPLCSGCASAISTNRPQGRRVAGVAAQIRSVRAVLCRGGAAVPCPWAAWRRSHRAGSSGAFPHPPVSHEPRITALSESLAKDGLHPFHLPLGILLDERDGKATPTSICIRCDAFDGFPCLLNGKADAQVICVDPALQAHPNLTLLTGAYAPGWRPMRRVGQ